MTDCINKGIPKNNEEMKPETKVEARTDALNTADDD
jgi:hypothetical protein